MVYSQVLRNQHDQLPESKEPIQQRHKLLKKPIQMLCASETLQRFVHGCFSVAAGKSKSFRVESPLEECYLCLPRLACHRKSCPQTTGLLIYLPSLSQFALYLLLSSFFSVYFLLQLLQKGTFLVQFLVRVGSLEQLSQSWSHGPQR